MKTNTLLFTALLLVTAIIMNSGCEKKSTSPPSNTKNSTSTTSTYYVSYTDTTAKTYKTDLTIELLLGLDTNGYQEAGWYLYGDYSYQAWLDIALPYDSSMLKNIQLNKKYIIYNYNTGIFPDSSYGTLSMNLTSNGTDSTVNETQTSTYYNEITALTYIGRSYDATLMLEVSNFVITGEFNVLVKNNVTHLSRVLSNGKYNFPIECLPK